MANRNIDLPLLPERALLLQGPFCICKTSAGAGGPALSRSFFVCFIKIHGLRQSRSRRTRPGTVRAIPPAAAYDKDKKASSSDKSGGAL